MADRHKILDSYGVTHWLRMYQDQNVWYLPDDPRDNGAYTGPRYEGEILRNYVRGYYNYNYTQAQTSCLNMVGTCSIILVPGTKDMPVTCFECMAGR